MWGVTLREDGPTGRVLPGGSIALGLESHAMPRTWGLTKEQAGYKPAPKPEVRCDRCELMFPRTSIGTCKYVRGHTVPYRMTLGAPLPLGSPRADGERPPGLAVQPEALSAVGSAPSASFASSAWISPTSRSASAPAGSPPLRSFTIR